jgi:plastocyanin
VTVRLSVAVVAGIAAVALAAPVAAQAAPTTRTVDVGLPASASKAFGSLGADVNDFFPHGVTIRVGDSVRFVMREFHTVNLPPPGGTPLPVIAPTGTTISGVNDAAGAPFWFNGQPTLNFNSALTKSNWGTHQTYSGATRVDSGLPLARRNPPMVVKFTRAGNFTYFCDVHVGMKGTVRVLAAGASIPSRAAVARAKRAQIARDLAIARRLTRARVPANTVDVGHAGPFGVEIFKMFPATRTISVGTRLTFRMSPGSLEDHTATFGPGPATTATTYLGMLAASFTSPTIDQRAIYPTQPPTGPTATLTPTLHGNGFWNSGVMDRSSATPLPPSASVTFGAAGTFTYFCLIHPFMQGTITVR